MLEVLFLLLLLLFLPVAVSGKLLAAVVVRMLRQKVIVSDRLSWACAPGGANICPSTTSDLVMEDGPEAEVVGLSWGPGENCGLYPGRLASDLAWPGTWTQKKNEWAGNRLGWLSWRPEVDPKSELLGRLHCLKDHGEPYHWQELKLRTPVKVFG